jgi:hypothetical protein
MINRLGVSLLMGALVVLIYEDPIYSQGPTGPSPAPTPASTPAPVQTLTIDVATDPQGQSYLTDHVHTIYIRTSDMNALAATGECQLPPSAAVTSSECLKAFPPVASPANTGVSFGTGVELNVQQNTSCTLPIFPQNIIGQDLVACTLNQILLHTYTGDQTPGDTNAAGQTFFGSTWSRLNAAGQPIDIQTQPVFIPAPAISPTPSATPRPTPTQTPTPTPTFTQDCGAFELNCHAVNTDFIQCSDHCGNTTLFPAQTPPTTGHTPPPQSGTGNGTGGGNGTGNGNTTTPHTP